nr:reverse transcriptase domain-containing protein [Tanacetum cinerariifolium]
ASHGQNPHLAYQAPGYQAPVYQALIPQPQVMTTTEFTNYMKANDSILKNMQTNMTSLSNSNFELKNMFGQFMKMNTASSTGSETLPSNTITNPKEDLKGITTRSGNAYKGPMIPTTPSIPKVVERETEVTKDTVHPTNNESTKDIQPSVVQIETLIPNSKPVVVPVVEPVKAPVSAPKPNPKPSIPYPSRLHDQKLCDKANDQKEKFFQIFQDLNFNISFMDALVLMPNFGPTIKSLLTHKEKLFELARTPLNEHYSAVLLKKLPKKLGDPGKFLIPCDFPGMDECFALADLGASINLMPLSVWNKLSLLELSPTCMTLELADRSISHPVGVAEDVFIGRALIDVYEGELTLRVGNKAITFNLDQTGRYSANYDDMSVNRIDLIDVACEEYSQEVLRFFMSGNPTPSTEPIVSNSSPTLTPFGDSDFLLEKTDALLAIDDVPISPEIDESYYDSEGDILLLEEFLNDDPSSPPLLPQEIKVVEPTNEKSSIDKPPMVKLKDLPPHLEYEFLEGDDKLLVIIEKDLEDEEKTALIKVLKSHKQALAWIEVDKAKVDVIAKLPHPTIVKGIRSFLGHAGFYRRFIQYFLKIARPMTRLLEKDTLFFFSKERVEAFQTLKKKLTKAPILVAPDWDLPFELMCDASEFAIGVVPGQRKTKHFQPIHYASKTMTNAQAHYTTTEKELLAVVYTFEKFWPYLVLSKSIVYTDHSALKYMFNKQDPKLRLRRWVLLLKEINITVRNKKGAENLAADHISPLENPHQNVFDKKEINETFPLETLNMVSFRGDSSTSCFTFETTPSCSKFVRIKSSGGVFTGKPLIFSRLVTMDLPGDIMAQTTLPKRENFSNEMKCLKIPSKFAKFLTYGASISWGRSCLHEGTSLELPMLSLVIVVHTFAMTNSQRSCLSENRASWLDKLDDPPWAFRTTFKTPIGYTPYKLVYEKACHLLIELEHKAYWALKYCNYDLQTTSDHRKVQLNELNELHNQAYENSLIYKEKTKRIRDSKIKDRVFNVGDRVLLFNSRLKILSGKLKTRWSGPFTITQVFPYGTIELSQTDEPNFKISKPSPRTNEFGDWVKLSDPKQALHGRNSRILKTRARGFVLRSLDLHILSFTLGIKYPNLIE